MPVCPFKQVGTLLLHYYSNSLCLKMSFKLSSLILYYNYKREDETFLVFSTVFNGSLGGNSFRCISRDKLWAEAGSGALKLSWEMAIIMVLSGLAFFLVTLAIVMAKKLSVLTKAGLHLPHRNSNASTAGSLSYTR